MRERVSAKVQAAARNAAGIAALALLAMLCAACGGRAGSGVAGNLVRNGDLSAGSGDSPDDWQAGPAPPDATTFLWQHGGVWSGALEISNVKPSDSHWIQNLHLGAGWYHFSASVRAEGVGKVNCGANLCLLEDGIISPALNGTTDWQTVGFYLRIGESGADVRLACRLGGYSSPNTGKAFCRDIRGVRIPAEPPPDTTPRFDLDVINGVHPALKSSPGAPISAATPLATPTVPERNPAAEHIEMPVDTSAPEVSRLERLADSWLDPFEWLVAVLAILATLWMATVSESGQMAWAAVRASRAWLTREVAAVRAEPARGIRDLNLVLLISIAAVVLLTAVEFLTFGSNAGGWIYDYVAAFRFGPLLWAIVISLVMVPLVHLSARLVARHQSVTLALWLVVGTAAQLVLHSFSPFALSGILQSDNANPFYSTSLMYHPYEFLSRYQEIAPSLMFQVKAAMPGEVLLLEWLGRITGQPQRLAILVIVIANLGGLFLYFIVAALYASREIALYALILYLFIPARIYFLPLLDVVAPVPVLACLFILVRFVASRGALPAFVLGMSLYAAILFDPQPFALGLFFVAIFTHAWQSGRVRSADALRLGVLAAAGFLLTYLAMRRGFHFDLVRVFGAVVTEAHRFNQSRGRPYAPWLWANLRDFFLNAGALPSLICVVYALVLADRRRHPPAPRTGAATQPLSPGAAPLMLVTLLATVAVIDLLGFNRGEVARSWIYLMVFVQVVAAGFCGQTARRSTLDIVLAGSIIQTAVTIAMVAFVAP
jgi:hypothetical protein